MPNPDPRSTPDPQRSKEAGAAMWGISGMGFELAASIVGMALLGWAIDSWVVKSGNLWLLICTAVGIIGGGYNFMRRAMALNRKAAQDYRTSHLPTRPPANRSTTKPAPPTGPPGES